MFEPIRVGEMITTPTEEEQEAITGGARARMPPSDDDSGFHCNPELLHEPFRPKWDPGGPPQLRR